MTGSRIVEHVRSVADTGNHGFLGMSEFHAHCATDTPAETTGRGTAKIACGLAQAEMLLRYPMIVDDEGITVSHLVDAIGQPSAIDGPFVARLFGFLFQSFTVLFVLIPNPLCAIG